MVFLTGDAQGLLNTVMPHSLPSASHPSLSVPVCTITGFCTVLLFCKGGELCNSSQTFSYEIFITTWKNKQKSYYPPSSLVEEQIGQGTSTGVHSKIDFKNTMM
jgi:hypothetical protein